MKGLWLWILSVAMLGAIGCKGGKTAACEKAFERQRKMAAALMGHFALGGGDKQQPDLAGAMDAKKPSFMEVCLKLEDAEIACFGDLGKAQDPKCQEAQKKVRWMAAPKPMAKPPAPPVGALTRTPTVPSMAQGKRGLSKLPAKLAEPLGQSTPEDIKKACDDGGLKCELKKWDKSPNESGDKYSVSFGDSGLWVNIWINLGATPDLVRMTISPGGRPAAHHGKMLISIDASDKGTRHDEGQRVLDALLGK